MSRSPITCHVLDASIGQPAPNVSIKLEMLDTGALAGQPHANVLASGQTDRDGRCNSLLDATKRIEPGVYKMTFQTEPYFQATHRETFYPLVEITFRITDPSQHHHIPLLISPFSYTTYRGS